MHHHIRKLAKDRKLAIKLIKSFAILVDSLTKTFSTRPFTKHQNK